MALSPYAKKFLFIDSATRIKISSPIIQGSKMSDLSIFESRKDSRILTNLSFNAIEYANKFVASKPYGKWFVEYRMTSFPMVWFDSATQFNSNVMHAAYCWCSAVSMA
jgi:hypothetical protein